jgi:hypothetical protein
MTDGERENGRKKDNEFCLTHLMSGTKGSVVFRAKPLNTRVGWVDVLPVRQTSNRDRDRDRDRG